MNRRDSIQKLLLGGGALFVIPSVLQSCSKDDDVTPDPSPGGRTIELDLTKAENAALNNAGGSRVVQSILVANTGTNFIAVSSVCTHEGCTVGYTAAANKIQCPCHGSEYSISGTVLQGPATRSLESYSVSRSGDILKITI